MTDWGPLLRAARAERGWSQTRGCEELRAASPIALPENISLLRSWKRWEAGMSPDAFYEEILCRVFGVLPPHRRPVLLVTGSRMWDDALAVHRVLFMEFIDWSLTRTARTAVRDGFEVLHGGADGADTITEDWVAGMKARFPHVTSRIVRPDYEQYARWEAPKIRNQVMVDARPHRVIAFHRANSGGAQDCIDRATKAGIPVHVYRPGCPDPEVITTLF